MKESDIVTQMAEHSAVARAQINKYGDTPVYYLPKRKWVRPPKAPGLSHFIQRATTIEEVNKLLEKGKTQFKDAQPKTIRKWEQEAAQRIEELKKAE